MKISIIIPAYNCEKYLNRCLDSVLNQTYNEFEIILVNDGSTDKTSDICDEYKAIDNRIKVIHKENGGVSSARNIGISKSTGEYIMFLDSDDWIERDMVEKLYNNISKYDDIDMGMCGCYLEFSSKEKQILQIKLKNKTYDSTEDYLKEFSYYRDKGVFGYLWNKIFRSSIIKDNQLLFKKYSIAEDLFFLYELLPYCNKIKVIEDSLYNYMHENEYSLSKSNKEDSLYINNLFYDKTKEFLYNTNSYEINKEYISNGYIQGISHYILNNVMCEDNKIKKLRKLYKSEKVKEAICYSNPKPIFYNIMNRLIKFNLPITTIAFLDTYKIIKKRNVKL